jgi:hypothetical protein
MVSQVAMKVLVDVFSVLSIEKCLLEKLSKIFYPEVVISLSDSVLESIAAETEDSKAERVSSTKKLEVLEATLKLLNRLDRHKPRSECILSNPLASSSSAITVFTEDLSETSTNSEGIETPPEEPEKEESEEGAKEVSSANNLEAAAAAEAEPSYPSPIDEPITEDDFAGFTPKKDKKSKKTSSKR